MRQEVREVKGESKVEGESLTSRAHVDGMTGEHKTHDLSHGECAQCDDVLTHKKNRTRRTQVFVLMWSVWKTAMVIMSSLVSVPCIVTTQA